jgi:integration host factor subunit beta
VGHSQVVRNVDTIWLRGNHGACQFRVKLAAMAMYLGEIVTKTQLIGQLWARNATLKRADIERAVDALLYNIANTLAKSGRIELRGFGSFATKRRAARLSRNPRTGEVVAVQAKTFVSFRAGKDLNKRLNTST